MPSKSAKQHRAMEAAAHGHSTLGIPASVGQEYVAADKAKTEDHGMKPGDSVQNHHIKRR